MRDLFENTDIAHFIYIRGFYDGSLVALYSEDTILSLWLQRNFPLSVCFDKECESLQTYFYWWLDKFPNEYAAIGKDLPFQSGFSIVRRFPKYFEMFGFADSPSGSLQASTYMSCLADFENLADYFVKAGKYIIKEVSQSPVMLPSHLAIPNHKEICLGENVQKYVTKGLLGETSISTYEFFSLQLLLRGKSYKEIGRILSVSHKTVEKYLSGFKKRTGYNPREISFLKVSENELEIICALKGNIGDAA